MHQKDKGRNKQYVAQREGAYWVTGTRVSLDAVVYAFLDGQTAESGAITFYLANRPDVDAYLCHEEAEFAAMRQAWRAQAPMFYQKMAAARRRSQTMRP